MPKRWRYLLVDVDGTLLNSQAHISSRSVAVLREAVAAGLTLVLATGRTYPSLLQVGAPLDVPFYMITNGGAVGLTPGCRAVPYVESLAAQLWPHVVRELEQAGLSAVVFCHRHPESPEVLIRSAEGDPHLRAYVDRNRAYARVAPNLDEVQLGEVVEVAALGAGNAFDVASARVCAALAPVTENHTMELFIGGRYGKITEFFAPGTSKWRAFLELFPDAAAHPETAVAIGDEANDQEMITAAGLGIVMGNATTELKALGDYVTADCDHDGLAQALEPLLAKLQVAPQNG